MWVPGASMQARAIQAFRSVSPIPVRPSSVSISTTIVSCAELVAPTSKPGSSSTCVRMPVIRIVRQTRL